MHIPLKKIFFISVSVYFLIFNAAYAETQKFISKDGTYSVKYPKQWHTFMFNDQLAGIQHYFISQKISPEKFKQEGADLDISFSLHVRQLKKSARNSSNQEILNQILKNDQKAYLQYKIKTILGNMSTNTIDGKVWVTATLYQPADQETKTYYLHKNGHFQYMLQVHVKDKFQKRYDLIIKQFIQSFKIIPASQIQTKKFFSHKKDFAVNLPKKWFYKEYNHKNTDQYLITRKKLVNKNSFFYVGSTITRFKNAQQLFDLDNYTDNKLKAAYIYKISQQSTSNGNKMILHSLRKGTTRQGIKIDIMERDVYVSKSDYTYREYHVIFLNKGSLYTCIFEAPITLFEKYRPTFESAYQSIIISK